MLDVSASFASTFAETAQRDDPPWKAARTRADADQTPGRAAQHYRAHHSTYGTRWRCKRQTGAWALQCRGREPSRDGSPGLGLDQVSKSASGLTYCAVISGLRSRTEFRTPSCMAESIPAHKGSRWIYLVPLLNTGYTSDCRRFRMNTRGSNYTRRGAALAPYRLSHWARRPARYHNLRGYPAQPIA